MGQQPGHNTMSASFSYKLVILLVLLVAISASAQNVLDIFLKPSDSLKTQRSDGVIISETVLAGTALFVLNELWYADYPRSDFHFVNDNAEWLQMDKAGHAFS